MSSSKNNSKKTILLLAVFTLLISFLLLYFKSLSFTKTRQIATSKINITTSLYPIYYLVSQIGGGMANVINITPPGVEPHDYEITNQDIYTIKNSQALILMGNVEPWADKILQNLSLANRLIRLQDVVSDKEDPHFWLSPKEFSRVADEVVFALIGLDSQNETIYKTNNSNLKNRLEVLDNKFQEGLKNCQNRSFITAHDAFGYLARDYNLRQLSIAGLSPEDEPSLKKLAEVSEFAKQNNVKYIFFESLVSPKLANTIAKEVGAQTLVLNPLEGLTEKEIEDGQDYFTIMENNFTNLKIALQCQ